MLSSFLDDSTLMFLRLQRSPDPTTLGTTGLYDQVKMSQNNDPKYSCTSAAEQLEKKK